MFMQHCCSSKSCISCLHSSSTKREKKSLRVQHSVSQTSEQKRVLISLTCFGFNKINNRGTTMKQPSKQEWFYRREPLTLFPHLFCLFFHQCCIWLGSVPLVIACGDTWSYRHCTSTVVLLQDGKSMCAVVRRFRLQTVLCLPAQSKVHKHIPAATCGELDKKVHNPLAGAAPLCKEEQDEHCQRYKMTSSRPHRCECL